MLYLVEHFYSIQGEGKFSGVPSLFFRFGGCNLKCAGFGTRYIVDEVEKVGCDSFYAVDSNFRSSWQEIGNLDQLISIFQYYHQNISHVVLTGGEPLIYVSNPVFLQFLQYLKSKNFHITIETNGTIAVPEIDIFRNITYSIALKLSNSGEEFQKRINIEAIRSIVRISKSTFFKFTIDQKAILQGADREISDIAKLFPNIPIYCMAIGRDREELEKNSLAVVDFCIKNSYIYSDRIHIRLWNGEKGY